MRLKELVLSCFQAFSDLDGVYTFKYLQRHAGTLQIVLDIIKLVSRLMSVSPVHV